MQDQKIQKISQALFYLNAAIWFLLGIMTFGGIFGALAVPSSLRVIIAILMYGNAGAMFLSGWGLGRGSQWYYILALIVILINIVLTFTDQVGYLDWITLGIDLILLFLLVSFRKTCTMKTRINPGDQTTPGIGNE